MYDNTGTLPWAFILDADSCDVDIEMTGFGMRDSSSFVVSGSFEFSSPISTACAKLATTQSSATGDTYSFVSSQSVSGKIHPFLTFKVSYIGTRLLTLVTMYSSP